MTMKKYIGRLRRGSGDERGFTLIELLVTVTIIGTLVAIVSIGVGSATSTASTGANKGTFNQVQASIDTYVAAGNTLSSIQGAVDSTVAAGEYYGADGLFTVATDGTTDTLVTLATLTSGGWLRLHANTGLVCIFSGTTSALKGCK